MWWRSWLKETVFPKLCLEKSLLDLPVRTWGSPWVDFTLPLNSLISCFYFFPRTISTKAINYLQMAKCNDLFPALSLVLGRWTQMTLVRKISGPGVLEQSISQRHRL
jgi:hypothetical protein